MEIVIHLGTLSLLNIPFGIWRGAVKKFSLSWFLAIHIPVLFSISIRKYLGFESSFFYMLVTIAVFVVTQRVGVAIYRRRTFQSDIQKP